MENSGKPPYLMSYEEWREEMQKCSAETVQSNYTRNSKSEETERMSRRIFLSFDVGKYTYEKACNGEEWALHALDYGLSPQEKFEKIVEKAKEQKLI